MKTVAGNEEPIVPIYVFLFAILISRIEFKCLIVRLRLVVIVMFNFLKMQQPRLRQYAFQ